MRNKKVIRNALIVGIIAILLGTTIFYPTNHAVNADSLAKPDWEEGDYWEYYCISQHNWTVKEEVPTNGEVKNITKMDGIELVEIEWIGNKTVTINHTHAFNKTYLAKETIIGNTTITVDNETYDVIVSETIGGSFKNGTPVYRNNDSHLCYYRKSDLALVKTIVKNESEVFYEAVCRHPSSRFDFPLDEGKEWKRTYNCTYSYPGHENMTWESEINYKCLRKEEVSTGIGVFECYVIKEYNSSYNGNYTLTYFSPYAGNIVKRVRYREGNITQREELISFSYHDRTHGKENDKNDIPAFEFLSLIMAMVAIILLSQKRLGGRDAKWKKDR